MLPNGEETKNRPSSATQFSVAGSYVLLATAMQRCAVSWQNG
ncbi:hypothetical protein [Methylogaea oryzae]|nr:hypothetical protein [Methylogaea oryzae]